MSLPHTLPHRNAPLLMQRIQNDLTDLIGTGSFPGANATLARIRQEVESYQTRYNLDALLGHHGDPGDDLPPVPVVKYPSPALAGIGGGR